MGFDPVSYMIGKSSSGGSVSDKNAYVSETPPSNSVGNDGDYYFELNSDTVPAIASTFPNYASAVGGWEFKANTARNIVGARVYVASAQTGKIIFGTASGTILKEITVNLAENEWTEVLFDEPVVLTIDTNYIIMAKVNGWTMMYKRNPELTTTSITYVTGRQGPEFPGTTESSVAYSVDVLYGASIPYSVKNEYYKSGGNWTEVM